MIFEQEVKNMIWVIFPDGYNMVMPDDNGEKDINGYPTDEVIEHIGKKGFYFMDV